ncbi:MAG: biotin--[acetyl-CoA-carboxylase] ligase [Clostridiales bacterium]|nr:biotin--[acetyl-CoA-carboxylase] ligase [Clostridiales bacterium]
MSTKDELLRLFESSKGEWISGGEIAEKLQISRTAIWKAVESLRADGYAIEAVKSRGYCLSPDTDIVSSQGVKKYLAKELDITVLEEVTSTNTLLKEMAAAGEKEGKIVIANSQTGGKGRMGRKFFSPRNSGVYISVLLRPDAMAPERALKITTMAAVAASRAIEEVTGKEAKIKWVNDIFVDGLKVVGILTEASMSMESGRLEFAVLGIGFNVYQPEGGFPEELREIAGALLSEKMPDAKNRIAAAFLNHFFEIYDDAEHLHYEDYYREKSLVLGKDVDVLAASGTRRALVLDITDDCNLIVRYEDGSEGVLSSGEVRIRPLLNGIN